VTIDDEVPRSVRRRIRDRLALMLMAFGSVLVLGAASVWHPLAGIATLGALVIGVGVVAGLE
jgi:hypothetical protein